jgi:hypothetical protein
MASSIRCRLHAEQCLCELPQQALFALQLCLRSCSSAALGCPPDGLQLRGTWNSRGSSVSVGTRHEKRSGISLVFVSVNSLVYLCPRTGTHVGSTLLAGC